MRTSQQDVAACRAFALQLSKHWVSQTLNDAADQIEKLSAALDKKAGGEEAA